MNAVSLYLRSRQDHAVILRQSVYSNLAEPRISVALRQRWQYERTWQNSNIPDGGLYYTEEVVVVVMVTVVVLVMLVVVVVVVVAAAAAAAAAAALQSFDIFCTYPKAKEYFWVSLFSQLNDSNLLFENR